MNMTCFESGDQNAWRIGRVFSAVSGLAWSGALAGATQTLSTPSLGASHDRFLPSGLSRTPARSGLPNSTLRGMRSALGLPVARGGGTGAGSVLISVLASVGPTGPV